MASIKDRSESCKLLRMGQISHREYYRRHDAMKLERMEDCQGQFRSNPREALEYKKEDVRE